MNSSSDDQELAARLDVTVKLLSLAYALISLIWLAWMLIPEHKRRLLAMQIAASLKTTAQRAASRTGRQAIAHEARSGCENYTLPYRLSLLAERAGRAYDRMRYTT